jgi:hypothetical protein
MPSNVVNINQANSEQSAFEFFLRELKQRGIDDTEIFTSRDEHINKTYSERWKLSNTSTRGRTTNLSRVYDLNLDYGDTQLLLKVFKYWAQTLAAGSTESRMGVICKIIGNYGFQIIADSSYLKAVYANLTTSQKKNLNNLFFALFETFFKQEFKEQREWAKDNLLKERINPHDPVNGAYSDYEMNKLIDGAIAKVAKKREWWSSPHATLTSGLKEKHTPTSFRGYSTAVLELLALLSSRRVVQFNQCKVCDVTIYSDGKDDVFVDSLLYEIRFFKAKENNSGFRGSPEGSPFPFSEVFSKMLSSYLADYKIMLKSLCDKLELHFEALPWRDYPLFPDINAIKLKEDLMRPKIHAGHLHRSLSGALTSFSINRVRHSTITRGMEMGLDKAFLARLTGVTTSAVNNYKDLTPQSRHLINERFNKNEFLGKAFNWTLEEYSEHFGVIHTDEFGRNLGGIKENIGCSGCSKKLAAPLGCYACGADLFIPFVEGDHKSQLVKAEAKKQFLKSTGANHHQMFEIGVIISRIEQVIIKQQAFNEKLLEGQDE